MSLKLKYPEFGQYLLETGDLDPVYIMLTKAELDRRTLCKWLLAYWCFYSCDLACQVAEAEDYWPAMFAASQPGQPRGMERRHFRGEKSIKAVRWLASHYDEAEAAVEWLIYPYPKHAITLENVVERVVTWPMFGPWIGWKITDMLERVMRVPIAFDDYEDFVIDEVLKSIELIEPGASTRDLMERLEREFSGYPAPPWHERSVNCQEVETIMCKFKAHCHGHYPPGKDTVEVGHSLKAYPGSLSNRLLATLPEYVPYDKETL